MVSRHWRRRGHVRAAGRASTARTAFSARAFRLRQLLRGAGARAALGRTFRPEEAQPANAAVAVVSHRLWRLALNSDSSVIGRPIHVGGQIVQVIGVATPGFAGTTIRLGQEGPDIWLPLAIASHVAQDSATVLRPDGLSFIGRLKPGVEPATALAAAQVVASQRAQRRLPARIRIGFRRLPDRTGDSGRRPPFS